jgi:hypothetical protein
MPGLLFQRHFLRCHVDQIALLFPIISLLYRSDLGLLLSQEIDGVRKEKERLTAT